MLENTPIIASFRFTFDELQMAEHAHNKQQKVMKIIVSGVLILFATGLIAGRYFSEGIPINDLIVAAILIPVLIFLFGFLYSFSDKYFRKKQFSLRGDSNKQVVIKISQIEIESEVIGVAATKMNWSSLAQVSRSDKGFLFYTKLGTYIWIPQHAFQSKADVDLVTKFSKQLAPKYIEQK